jgi:hypothetical protein
MMDEFKYEEAIDLFTNALREGNENCEESPSTPNGAILRY